MSIEISKLSWWNTPKVFYTLNNGHEHDINCDSNGNTFYKIHFIPHNFHIIVRIFITYFENG